MSAGPEDILQMQVARFLKIAAPNLCWHHVPNGGFRNPREARKLKDMGVLPGVADLCLMLSGGRAGWIELKAEGGRQTDTQKAFQAACAAHDHPYAICRSIDDVIETLQQWGVKTRARSPE